MKYIDGFTRGLRNKKLSGQELMSKHIEILSMPYEERCMYETIFRTIVSQMEERKIMNKESAKLTRKNYYNPKYYYVPLNVICSQNNITSFLHK